MSIERVVKAAFVCIFAAVLVSIGLAGCGGGSSDGGGGSGGGSDGSGPDISGGDEGGSVDGANIQFDLSDAVAVMKASRDSLQTVKNVSTSSNLLKLTTSNEIKGVFTGECPVYVSGFYIAPDGSLYISLEPSYYVAHVPDGKSKGSSSSGGAGGGSSSGDDSGDGGGGSSGDPCGNSCALMKLTKDNTGVCIDDELEELENFDYSMCEFKLPPIQFDDAGNIYYQGRSVDWEGVLRRYDIASGQITDLINDNIRINDFIVDGDGTVYLSGYTSANNTNFFRRISTDGSLATLLNGSSNFMVELPDDHIYVSAGWEQAESWWGIRRISNGDFDDGYYTEGYFDISYFFRSPDDRAFVVDRCGDYASLWELWPAVQEVITSVDNPVIVRGTLSTLLISGYDDSGVNKLISYNTGDGAEVDLLNGQNIEIYHFNYSADSGKILFDGLNFSNNTYIVGIIDTQNGNELTVLDSGVRYSDFQFFN